MCSTGGLWGVGAPSEGEVSVQRTTANVHTPARTPQGRGGQLSVECRNLPVSTPKERGLLVQWVKGSKLERCICAGRIGVNPGAHIERPAHLILETQGQCMLRLRGTGTLTEREVYASCRNVSVRTFDKW